jgi:hypothetical protein
MRKLQSLGALVALVLTFAASGQANVGIVRITGVTVHPNRTVSLDWRFQDATDTQDTVNNELKLDGKTIKYWGTLDRSTHWQSLKALTPGTHTISISAQWIFWTNTYYENLNCDVSKRSEYLWICDYVETATRTFTVGGGNGGGTVAKPAARASVSRCVVPDVKGLRFKDARSRLRESGCILGRVKQVVAQRGGGTVLQQKPRAGGHFARGATVDLWIAKY